MAAPAPGLLDSADVSRLQRLSVRTLAALTEALIGQREGSGRGGVGVEFAEHRRYVPGDDLRRIDWNAFGRLDELLIKVSPVETRARLVVMLDTSASMAGETEQAPSKLRYGRRLAALLGAIALLRSDSVQVQMLSDGHATGASTLDAPGLLGSLAYELEHLPAGVQTQLGAAVAEARTHGGGGDVVVLISDALVPEEDLGAALRELSRAGRFATLLHVLDPAEAEAGTLGGARLRDRETGEMITTEITELVRQRYRQRYAEMLARVERRCRAAGVNYLRMPTDEDPLDALLRRARGGSLVAST
jgi:uncharacterized protein (DUF58 family)